MVARSLFAHRSTSVLVACVCAALLVGCPAGSPGDVTFQSSKAAPVGAASLGSLQLREVTGAALIQGAARGPAGAVGGNIIAGNSSRIIANNGSGILAGNSSRFRALAVAEDPIANAIVYLTDPDEHFFAAKGQPLVAATDAKGLYKFAEGVPVGQIVIVNVMLSDNRREVGFTVSKAGRNSINVSLATTYVTEFLRQRAKLTGKTMGDFDLTQLESLTQLTQQALDRGDLPVPDLGIGNIPTMNQTYALAVGLNRQGLGDAWAAMLGQRVLALTTIAGNGQSGTGGDGKAAKDAQLQTPKGVTRDAAGNLYVSDERGDNVRIIKPDGTIDKVAGSGMNAFNGDNGPAKNASLWWPRTLAMGPDGGLYVADTLNQRIRRIDLAAKTITTWAGNPDQSGGAFLNDFAGDGGPASKAKFAGVRSMVWDSTGAMVLSDSWSNDGGKWNHIRRIDRNGTITSLVGVDNTEGFNGDGLPGLQSQCAYVQQLAIDAQDNIYFADARNHRVRRYDAKTKLVTTVLGNGTGGAPVEGAKATATMVGSPMGLAIDSTGRLFVSDVANREILMVRTDGTLHVLAGGGTYAGDGEADALALTEPHDLLIEPDGNLVFVDARASKLRRIWLKFGI